VSFDRDPTPITVRLEPPTLFIGSAGLGIGQGVSYWHAHAIGGGSLEYQFWRRTPAGWSLARDYDPNPNFVWLATSDQIGECALQVLVRNVGSAVDYDAYAQIVFRVLSLPVPIATRLDLTPTREQFGNLNLRVGRPVAFIANAINLPGAEYSFWRRDGTTWLLVEPYSYRSSYTWTPTASDVGILHDVEVRVRQRGSTVAYLLWRDAGESEVYR